VIWQNGYVIFWSYHDDVISWHRQFNFTSLITKCVPFFFYTSNGILLFKYKWISEQIRNSFKYLGNVRKINQFHCTESSWAVHTYSLDPTLSVFNTVHSSHPISRKSILILFFQPRLSTSSGLFHSGFPANILHAFLIAIKRVTCLPPRR
jgi:hypothetical protein